MPNIKPESTNNLSQFLSTSKGEALTVIAIGSSVFTSIVSLIGFILVFTSQTLYPFSYSFLRLPFHTYLPGIITSPPLLASLLFGSLLTAAIYYYEKNIFYRRFHILLKAGFASVAACVMVFVSNLVSAFANIIGADVLSNLLYTAEASDLPLLFIYYYFISLPIFALCTVIRRKIFGLP